MSAMGEVQGIYIWGLEEEVTKDDILEALMEHLTNYGYILEVD